MKTFVIIIGILCLISGLIEIIVPAVMRNIAKKILPKMNNRIIGFLPLVVGVLLFYASQNGRLNLYPFSMKWKKTAMPSLLLRPTPRFC